jgi:hypothetical protein
MGVAAGIGQARADVPPGAACTAAGHSAEQEAALPVNLLISIGMVESGHPDPLTGRFAPWPWTVNADGNGQYFPTKEAAEAFVRFAEASGARDIDVGCFQISLQSHPDAFVSLDEAFDPDKNAAYAARFLTQLKGQTGSWTTIPPCRILAFPISGWCSPPGSGWATCPSICRLTLRRRATSRRRIMWRSSNPRRRSASMCTLQASRWMPRGAPVCRMCTRGIRP